MKHLLLLVIFLTIPLIAQETVQDQEIDNKVEELSDFHEVIYPIWHTAYPTKDYAMLREMTDSVNSGAEKIYDAKLPGFLREKQKKWDEALVGFKKAVEDYNTAAAGENNEALLTAAEVLHTQYEILVRCIRPVLPEVEDFHKTLYVVYHNYFPAKNYTRIKELIDEFISKATKVKDAKLPSKLRDRTEAYTEASNGLYHSTLALKEAFYSNNSVLIENAVEKMHSDYQRVEAVFD